MNHFEFLIFQMIMNNLELFIFQNIGYQVRPVFTLLLLRWMIKDMHAKSSKHCKITTFN